MFKASVWIKCQGGKNSIYHPLLWLERKRPHGNAYAISLQPKRRLLIQPPLYSTHKQMAQRSARSFRRALIKAVVHLMAAFRPAALFRSSSGRLRPFAVVLAVFFFHLAPLLYNGSNAYVRIHDNLEGEWAWLMLLVKLGKALDFSGASVIPQILGGQPRMTLPSGLSVNVLFIWLFGGLNGYKVSYALSRLLAFVGMYRLLRVYFLPEEKEAFIRLCAALCFSLVPFYVQFGVALQPFLLHCWLNLMRSKANWADYVCLLLVPFYSSIVWMRTSAVILLGGLWLGWTLWKCRFRLQPLMGIGLLSLSYLLVNLSLLQLYLDPDFTSHRKHYDALAMMDIHFSTGLAEALFSCVVSQYHAGTVVALPLLVLAAVALRSQQQEPHRSILKYRFWQTALCLVLIALISLLYGLYPYIAAPLDEFIPLLSQLRFNRMIIALPLLFFLVFALSLSILHHKGFSSRATSIVLACQLVMGFFSNDEWLHNMRRLWGAPVKPGYAEFWAEDLFKRIDRYIGQPQHSYRVANLGIHPAVAQHNGFYTLDGLLPVYRLEHKVRFRSIIADEIAKDPRLSAYFDEWGNRCYLFSAELGLSDQNNLIDKNSRLSLNDFRFNAEAFKQMGGRYVFSALLLQHPERAGLRLLKVFEPTANETSWWKIYLYEAV